MILAILNYIGISTYPIYLPFSDIFVNADIILNLSFPFSLHPIGSTKEGIAPYASLFSSLSNLSVLETHPVSLQARKMVTISQLPSFEESKVLMEKQLLSILTQTNGNDRKREMDSLVKNTSAIFHILSTFFNHPNFALKAASLEVYVRRAYSEYNIKDLKVFRESDSITVVEWRYTSPTGNDDNNSNSNSNSNSSSNSTTNSPSLGIGMTRVESDNNLFALGKEAEDLAVGQEYVGIFYFFEKGQEELFSNFDKVLDRCSNISLYGGSSPPQSPHASPLLKFPSRDANANSTNGLSQLERQILVNHEKMRTVLKLGFNMSSVSNTTNGNGNDNSSDTSASNRSFDEIIVNKFQEFWNGYIAPMRKARIRRYIHLISFLSQS